MMIKNAGNVIKRIAKFILTGCIGALIILVTLFVLHLESRPELKVWHEAILDAEFTANSHVVSFSDYLALEEKLFAQLKQRVLEHIKPDDQRLIKRYHRGSLSDPGQWPHNWNRTFELTTEKPRAGVLLLHGMSDSPYSLRNIGQSLKQSGAWVIGLRLPGHGTAPSGLVTVQYEDMAAVVQLTMQHLQEKVPDGPLYIVGYSNGGALAIHYAQTAIEDSSLPRVKAIALISPSIGVAKVAALAVWQGRLGHLLGLDKLAWSDLQPEYDPFKYSSFAVNAGDQVYRLTGDIQQRFEALRAEKKLQQFPPVMAFQSAIDATVSTRAVVDNLFEKLPEGGHEFILFDINRSAEIENILTSDPKEVIDRVINRRDLSFTFSLISNSGKETSDVMLHQKKPGHADINVSPLNMQWPIGLYSLSHIALPFPKHDPLYGKPDTADNTTFQLGSIDLRGERDGLQIPAAAMLRLRWNPFYPYLERRLLEMLLLKAQAKPSRQ